MGHMATKYDINSQLLIPTSVQLKGTLARKNTHVFWFDSVENII